WVQVRSRRDAYEGHVPRKSLSGSTGTATHRVSARLALVYSEPDFTCPVTLTLSLGSDLRITETRQSTRPRSPAIEMGRLQDGRGWIPMQHVSPVDALASSPSDTARRFLGTPYLYGGRSALGIDCSALVQLSWFMAGRSLPRDTRDQITSDQLDTLPPCSLADIPKEALILIPGHVLISTGGGQAIHADGISFSVVGETIEAALAKRGVAAETLTIRMPRQT
ncbi:MAG: hypothetical protein CMF75_09695, partial [Maricaulis sp.]|nr:hypothetical protein [Maricaulis sp.]